MPFFPRFAANSLAANRSAATLAASALVAALTLGLPASPATAQDAQAESQASAEPTGDNSIIREAASAARSLKSLKAKVTLTGAGGFKDFVPTADGTTRLLKTEPGEDDHAWISRVDAEYTHKKGAETQDVTAVRTPLIFAYTDHDKKAVIERSRDNKSSIFASVVDLLALPELTSPTPYERELEQAESWEVVGRETINGIECDVVEIRYDMSKGDQSATGQLTRTPNAKWYFGVADRIPRRVERITDEGMISFTIILELSDVEINPGFEPDALEIETPEGYSRTVSASRTGPTAARPRTGSPNDTTRDVSAKKEQIDPANIQLPAHGFELVDGDGNAVSLESLQGNIAVLYFWGTWCVPCKQFSPLVSDLADTFEGQPVKVFGLPVRERSEQAVRDAMGKYSHTLLLDPGERVGCDLTARAYKVRRYPTIYVIGPDSRTLAVRTPESGVEPAEIVAQIESLIREQLASMN